MLMHCTKFKKPLMWIVASLIWFAPFIGHAATCGSSTQSPIILLKLDDLVANPQPNNDMPVSKRWQKVTDYLESNGIAASYGIIGDSLEKDNPAYFAWLKKRISNGFIEFWSHGYVSQFTPNSLVG